MIASFYDLVVLVVWIGSFGLLAWWLWGMRKASRPREQTPREVAELASLRAAIDRDQDQLLRGLPPSSDPTRPTA